MGSDLELTTALLGRKGIHVATGTGVPGFSQLAAGCGRTLDANRRAFLAAGLGAATWLLGPTAAGAERKKRLGLVTYCCRIRQSHLQQNGGADLSNPAIFLDHCQKLDAGGMQISLRGLNDNQAANLRESADERGLFIEAIVTVPKKRSDIQEFESSLRIASLAGVKVARTTIIPGRRYEYFTSLDKFREYEARGRQALEWAAPIAEKHQVALAVENHKDHRNAERVALFEHIGSEFVGACVDTGNSVALLEDPFETAAALAPWAHSVHLKDQAVQPYADGFLLADIPLGQGCLPLKKIVTLLRQAKPHVNFSLELITRDPLKVPTLSEQYWATFPNLPGRHLARTMRMVRDKSTDNMQYVSKMTPEQKLAQEDANVRQSLDYAKRELNL